MKVKDLLPVTGLNLRSLIEKSAGQYFPSSYVPFSFSMPRVAGELDGYRVEYGARIYRSNDGNSLWFFYRVKTKTGVKAPLFLRDNLGLNGSVSLRFGWVYQEEPLYQSDVDLILLEKIEKKNLPSVKRKISELVSIAREIDEGTYNLASTIQQARVGAKKESITVLWVFGVGTAIVLGLAFLYLRFLW